MTTRHFIIFYIHVIPTNSAWQSIGGYGILAMPTLP